MFHTQVLIRMATLQTLPLVMASQVITISTSCMAPQWQQALGKGTWKVFMHSVQRKSVKLTSCIL